MTILNDDINLKNIIFKNEYNLATPKELLNSTTFKIYAYIHDFSLEKSHEQSEA